MKPIVVFAAGAVVGAVVAVLSMQAAPCDDASGVGWRDRAERAERELALERNKTAALTTQMGQLAERFDKLAARLETLSSTAAEVFREASGQDPASSPTPTAVPPQQ